MVRGQSNPTAKAGSTCQSASKKLLATPPVGPQIRKSGTPLREENGT